MAALGSYSVIILLVRTSDELPVSIRALLVAAGWQPGRRVDVPLREFAAAPIFPAAERILTEFCSLRVGTSGAGQECARSDVDFDPLDLAGEESTVERFLPAVGRRLFPLGNAHNCHLLLFIDEDERVFCVGDCLFSLVGFDFVTAMEALLLGRRSPIFPLPSIPGA